jgi:hypothetical protein
MWVATVGPATVRTVTMPPRQENFTQDSYTGSVNFCSPMHRTLTRAYQRVSGGNGIQAFNAGIYNMTQSSGNEQVVAAVGMRHRF